MNTWIIDGRLIKDAEIKNGTMRACISHTVGKKKDENGNDTDEWESFLVDTIIFKAESLPLFRKGERIMVSGEYYEREYNGKVYKSIRANARNIAVIPSANRESTSHAEEESTIPF